LNNLILIGILYIISISTVVFFLIIVGVVKLDVVSTIIVTALITSVVPVWLFILNSNNNKNIKPIKISFPKYQIKQEFEAEIVDKQKFYIRGKSSITFRSRYEGEIKNGYFANEITVSKYPFPLLTLDISNNGYSVKTYCKQTIENSSSKKGNLKGNKKTDWYTWVWNIPNNAPLDIYTVKMMVFDENKIDPIDSVIDSFEVVDPDATNYNHFNRVSI
jgi:hypothetical protein